MCCATYISIGCMHVVYIAAGSSKIGQWHKETSNDEGTGSTKVEVSFYYGMISWEGNNMLETSRVHTDSYQH